MWLFLEIRQYQPQRNSGIIPRGTDKQMQLLKCIKGESSCVQYNHCIGEFILKGIPLRATGEETIEVSFSYNQNGMLHVTGTIVSTVEEATIEINMLNTREKQEDVSKWKSSNLAGEHRTVVRRVEKWLKKHTDEDKVENLLYQLKKAILADDAQRAEEYEEKLHYYIGEL